MTPYELTEKTIMSVVRAYQSKDPKVKEALKLRKKYVKSLNKDIQPEIDENYWCETCGSHSHKEHPVSGYCFICDTDNWIREKGANIG